jgi:hypothetical protein
MYIWRRWRDTSVYFFISLILLLPLVISFSTQAKGDALQAIVRLWGELGVPVGLIVGLLIGSRSIGTEIGGGYGDFVMTRPRSRKYFVWIGWSLGVIELLTILAIITIFTAGALSYEHGFFWRQSRTTIQFTRQLMVVDIPLLLASIAVFTLVVYSATYLASVLTRRSGIAMGITFGCGCAYQVIVNRVGWAHSHFPEMLVTPYYEVSPLHIQHMHTNAVYGLVIWLVCVLLFPLIAQLVFEGTET